MFLTQNEPEGVEPACWELIVSVQNGERLSLEQIRAFLEASGEIEFDAANRREVYDWVTRALCEQEYWKQSREVKGMLRRYIGKMTGLSRAQVTRLISRYKQSGRVSERSYRRNRFASHYTPADIELLAQVDEAHEILSGPATQKILYREFHDYGSQRYERLAAPGRHEEGVGADISRIVAARRRCEPDGPAAHRHRAQLFTRLAAAGGAPDHLLYHAAPPDRSFSFPKCWLASAT